jgi:hypothetical protein
MSALATAPLPVIIALAVFAFAFLGIVAKAVFAATDEPARRLCAILATLRRQRPGVEAWRGIPSTRLSAAADSRAPAETHSTITISTSDVAQQGGTTAGSRQRRRVE